MKPLHILASLWARWRDRIAIPPPAGDNDALSRLRLLADIQLRRARIRAVEVDRVARVAREYQAENHFAEMITETFRGGEG